MAYSYLINEDIPLSSAKRIQKIFYMIGSYEIRNHINNILTQQERIWLLKMCGDWIVYINNPTEEEQITAVTQDTYNIMSIKNPTQQVQFLAKLLE